jgi:hypothetical protein
MVLSEKGTTKNRKFARFTVHREFRLAQSLGARERNQEVQVSQQALWGLLECQFSLMGETAGKQTKRKKKRQWNFNHKRKMREI